MLFYYYYLQQEPADTVEDLINGIRWVRPGGDFIPKLTHIFEKIDVNGANEAPIYTYFKVKNESLLKML